MRSLWFLLGVSLIGCTTEEEPPPPDCLPSEATWNAEIQPLVAERCGLCHGEEPDNGAPFSLLHYDTLIEGQEGARIVDFMVDQISEGTMPPVGAPTPSLHERDVISAWASCGDTRVDEEVGLHTNRPPFVSPVDAPEGLETIDVRLDHFAVAPTVRDHYEDKDFSGLVEEDVFIRRIEAIVDESRVVHHLTLRRGNPESGDGDMKYLYTWAPGTGAFEFPEGGIRLSPNDNLRLQIHYNNGASLDDVEDSSGIRLFVGPTEGTEYAMADPGPGAFGFNIPARDEKVVETTCTVREPVTVIASMPHMHEIGTTFEIDVAREGRTGNVLRLDDWSFNTQLFYELPIELEAGDELTVRCGYTNTGPDAVNAGPRTSDEMCFAFTYVTPAVPDFCTAGGGDVTHLEYTPSACIDDPLSPSVVTPTATSVMPTVDETATLPEGHWVASRVVLVTSMPAIVSVATITLAGQLAFDGDTVEGDAAVHIVAPVPELRNGRQIEVGFAGTLTEPSGPSGLGTSCGSFPEGAQIAVVDGVPAVAIPFGGMGVDIMIWVYFDPA